MQSFLLRAGAQFHKPASKVFADILQQELLSVHIYITACLPTVIKLLESRDTGTIKLTFIYITTTYLHSLMHIIMLFDIWEFCLFVFQLQATYGWTQWYKLFHIYLRR